MSLFVFNNQQKLIKSIPNRDLISMVQDQAINVSDTLFVEMPADIWSNLKEPASYLAVQDPYERFIYHMYKVSKHTTKADTTDIEAIQIGYDELKAYGYIKDRRFNNRPVLEAATAVVSGTDWQLGYIDTNLPNVNTNFYYISRLEALSKLIEATGAEVRFRIEISGNKIIAKRLDLYKQLGTFKGKRFAYGSNLLEIIKEEDTSELYTALVGRGKGEETDTGGFGRRITFADIAWSKAGGDPVDKPLGQEFIELPEMTAYYGYPDGEPRTGIVEFGDIEEPELLLKATYERLVETSRPQVQFKAKIQTTGDMQLGEEVAIIRSDLGFRYKTRVFRVKRDYLNNTFTEVELGDKLTETLASRIKKIDTTSARREETIIQYIQTAANGKNKIFRGVAEPTEGMMVNDLWYKPIGDGEMEMYQWDGVIWELILSTLDTTKVQQEVEAALSEAEAAKQTAENAYNDAVAEAERLVDEQMVAFDAEMDTRKGEILEAKEQADLAISKVDSNAEAIFGKLDASTYEANKTTVESNISGLQTTVADKADKSQITQLNTSISTKVESSTYNTKMTQLDNAINLRVVQGDVTAAILADKKIKDTRTTNELPSWYFANYPRQRVEEFKSTTTIGVPGATTFTKLVTDVPWNDESGGVVTQNSYSTYGVHTRASNVAGTAWGEWVKQTDSANVLAQINLSSEGVLIQGKRIQLDGDVTMTAAYVTKLNTQTLSAITANITSIRSQVLVTDSVTSTHIKAENALIDGIFGTTALITRLTSKTAFVDNIKAINISADKVTTGTLNAANVNIINLNANNIVSGTFTGLNYKNPFTFWYGGKQFSGETTINNGGINQYGSASDGTQVSLTLTGGGLKTQYGTGSTNISPARIEFVSQNGTESLVHYSDSESVLYTSSYVGGGLGAYRKRNGVEEFRSLLKTETDWASYSAVVIRGNLKANDINFPNGSFIYDNASKDLFVSAPRHLYLRTNGVSVLDLDPITSQIRTYLNIDMNNKNLWNVANITQTSDERLKNSITPTLISGLGVINALEFYDYYWNDRPEIGKQFGLIAQRSPFVSEQNGPSGYWGINMNKLSLATAMAVKEVDTKVERIDTYVSQHELEIKILKERIKQLEEKLA